MEMPLHCHNHWDVVEGLRQCGRCGLTFCRDCLVDIHGIPYCARCKNEQLLDVQSGVPVVNPTLDLANPWRRFLAWIIDTLLFSIPVGVTMLVAILSRLSTGKTITPDMVTSYKPLNALMTLLMVLYEGLMLSSRGQTIGKMALKVKVVRIDGSDLTTGQAWGRTVMRYILGSCLCFINYLPAFFTQERTTLHDMVASTRVINWS